MRLSGTQVKKVVFGLVLLGVSFLIFLRHRQVEETGALRWYDRTLIFLTAPVARGITFTEQKIRLVVGRYLFLVRVERENEDLRRKIGEYRVREMELRSLEGENRRLRRLADLGSRLSGEWVTARVISYPPIGPYRILTIGKGAAAGIERRAPVVAADGLVGQVLRTTGSEAQVLLITDPTSAVDARIEKTEARGLIVGKTLQLGLIRDLFIGAFEYLNRATEIEEGSAVVTSGLDGVYPPGILIGTVHGRQRKKYDVFQQAEVIPAVDFYRLQEVLVLKKP